ncbi:MAG: penicillin-binding transpeptidase domain-containing protein, partial [Gammaproteobacteria bacterium]|nr:penicillin-binding transpeptidase domain-containing protein [Gammaproteobacteria bacterium]
TIGPDSPILGAPFAEWPEDMQRRLQDYGNPAGLSVALVTSVNGDNSVDIMLQNGTASKIEWFGISWARPYIDRETTGPAPSGAADVLTAGDIVYVMPITVGGWALAQLPTAQSALVSIDPQDGAITSLVGGLDFSLSKFNRATQSARQPGSSFKPFIYSAALEAGNTLATIVLDAPVVISSTALERLWRPVNYSGRFYGEQRVREAMVRSMNLASVRLLLNNTGIGKAVEHLRPFGFNDAALPRNGSLALGGGNASPLDMAQAFATFANGGYAVKPYVIDAIIGPNDEVLYRAEPVVVCPACEPEEEPPAPVPAAPAYPVHVTGSDQVAGVEPADRNTRRTGDSADRADDSARLSRFGRNAVAVDDLDADYEMPAEDSAVSLEQMADLGEDYRPDATVAPDLFADVKLADRIISPQNAFLIQDAMRDVIRRGTGVRARVLGRSDLSGKTGTSNDRRDAWFAGFNADLVGVVWVGYDDDSALGPREEGSRTALPVWIEFIRRGLAGVPDHRMDMPEGIVTVRISKTTGCPADASTPVDDVMFEHFREDTVPECAVDDVGPDIFNAPDENTDLF